MNFFRIQQTRRGTPGVDEFWFPEWDDHIARVVRHSGRFYEHDLLNHLWQTVAPGGLVIDLGAHIGNHTLFFARYLARLVLAVEPHPVTYQTLEAVVARNGLDNVLTVRSAVSDQTGMRLLGLPNVEGVNTGMYTLNVAQTSATTVPVAVERLDRLLERLPVPASYEISLIKLDVEGAESAALTGATRTLDCHRPDLVIEIQTAERLGEVRRQLAPWGYRVVGQFCKTPTYHFAAARPAARRTPGRIAPLEDRHQRSDQPTAADAPHLHVGIMSYNRRASLERLLTQLTAQPHSGRLTIDLFDDGSDADYSFLTRFSNLTWYRRPHNGGKQAYWSLWNAALQKFSAVDADYFIMLPDDVELIDRFLDEAVRLWHAIDDEQKICLNLMLDESRAGQPCWTGFTPELRQFGDDALWLTQWNDCIFFAPRVMFASLGFQLEPIPANRWHRNPTLSSGVGQQTSLRLHTAGYNTYQVTRSLVSHGTHSSQMHPAERRRVPLISTWTTAERVIGGLATIPARSDALQQAVDSILPQIDELHVYLNEFTNVPEFLDDPRLIVHRSQEELGDLGDAGKFFSVGGVNGYYLSLDDDIVYPPDYVRRMLAKIEAYERRACVSLHGVNFEPPLRSYYANRSVLHCRADLKEDQGVHLVGTGVLAFHTESIRLSVEDFPRPNMADIWFALAAQRQQVGLIAVEHRADWLNVLPVGETIYDRHHRDDGEQTELINAHHNWSCWGKRIVAVSQSKA